MRRRHNQPTCLLWRVRHFGAAGWEPLARRTQGPPSPHIIPRPYRLIPLLSLLTEALSDKPRRQGLATQELCSGIAPAVGAPRYMTPSCALAMGTAGACASNHRQAGSNYGPHQTRRASACRSVPVQRPRGAQQPRARAARRRRPPWHTRRPSRGPCTSRHRQASQLPHSTHAR